MPLSYAGVDLPVLTQEAYAAIESRISLRDLYAWDIVPSDVGRAGYGLAAKKWQDRIPRLGRLSWPTGASRWATGFFVATDVQLAAIRDVVYAGDAYSPADLVIGDGTNTITASMYMLPARPLFTGAEGQELWLLVVVDQRYFWWQKRTGNLNILSGATWSNVYSDLMALLPSVAFSADSVNSAYQTAPTTLSAVDETIPPLLDYAARSVGQRIVIPLLGDEVHAYNYESSLTLQQDNLALLPKRIGGSELNLTAAGDTRGFLPESVAVDFPQADSSGNLLGKVSTVTVSLSSLSILSGYPTNAFTVTLVHPFEATVSSSGTWTNNTTCTALAQQFATDYYLYQTSSIDAVYAGIVPWQPEGLEDWIEWTYTSNNVTTRVQRAPRVIGEPEIVAGSPVVQPGFADTAILSLGYGRTYLQWPAGAGNPHPTLPDGSTLLRIQDINTLVIDPPGWYLIGAAVVFVGGGTGEFTLELEVTNTDGSSAPPFTPISTQYASFGSVGNDVYMDIPGTPFYCKGSSALYLSVSQSTGNTWNVQGYLWLLPLQAGLAGSSGGGGGGGGGPDTDTDDDSNLPITAGPGIQITPGSPSPGQTTIAIGGTIDCGTWV